MAKKIAMSIASGIVTALFILSMGFAYVSITNSQSTLLTDQLRVLLGIVTSGLAFGYWMGLSTKEKSYERGINLFFMSFFGTFCIILTYMLLAQEEYIQLFPLFFAISMPFLIINSDLIEHSQLQIFEKSLKIFSEKLSFPTLGIYLMSSFVELEGFYLIVFTVAIYSITFVIWIILATKEMD